LKTALQNINIDFAGFEDGIARLENNIVKPEDSIARH
jgi:hypothetical protein